MIQDIFMRGNVTFSRDSTVIICYFIARETNAMGETSKGKEIGIDLAKIKTVNDQRNM